MSPRSFSRLLKTGTALALASLSASSLYALPENLGLGLKEMAQDYRNARPAGVKTLSHDQVTSIAAKYPRARFDDQDRVQVEVALDGSVPFKDAIAAFEAQGCTVTGQLPWFHQGLLSMSMPLDKAGQVAKLAGVDSVRLSLKPRHHAGKVPGTGAKVLNALAAQTNYSTTGAGITVGAQSDSYDGLDTTYPVHAAQDIASGDLPGTTNPEGYTTPVNVLSDIPAGFGTEDEGRAMLQIIHDVAPGAGLAFATADISESSFAANILALAGPTTSTYTISYVTSTGRIRTKTVNGAGCKVVCDDIGYGDEPFFSDGPVAQAVDKASAAGAVYFSSAGNDGNSGYRATFNPVNNDTTAQALLLSEGGITYSGIGTTETGVISKFHSFGTNPDGTPILVQKVLVPLANASSYPSSLTFQWDDPFSVTTGGVKQVSTDYDILCFSVAANGTATYVAANSGVASNHSTNTPIEAPSGTYTPGTQYELVIVQTNRAAPTGVTANQATHIAWTLENDANQIVADFVTPGSFDTHGHNCAATCVGAAAYIYDDQFSAASSTYTPLIEAYSSNGPSVIYFDSAGNRLATPITRKQPLLSFVDGVSTTFFPPNADTVAPGPSHPINDTDGDGYPNFFGTSAAAPHGAGCAALILSAAAANGVTVTPADVRSLLANTTQGQSDQDPTVSNATAGSTKFAAQDRGTYADPQAYTITYNGAAGTTLNTLVFDLSTVPGNFAVAKYPVTTGAAKSGVTGGTAPAIASSTVTAADGTSTGTTTLTLTLTNFVPGSTLSFGAAQTVTVTGGNYYLHGDQLAGATIKATDSTGTTSTGTLANTYSKKWNYKSGYGLADVNAAIARMLGR